MIVQCITNNNQIPEKNYDKRNDLNYYFVQQSDCKADEMINYSLFFTFLCDNHNLCDNNNASDQSTTINNVNI